MPTHDLFSPLRFRNGAVARHRVVLAPMTNQQSHDDGSLSDDELHWLERRADGGFAVIETCAAHVSRDGQAWRGELGVFDDTLAPGLARLAASLRAREVMSLVQLFHGGARADAALTGEAAWTAAPIPGDEAPMRIGTTADIERVVGDFVAAAVRCHRAGFDGVELHGAHGYLLCQFLSRYNTRTDGWGDSLEGRMRLVRTVAREIRARVPASFIVGVRLSPEDWGSAKGLDLDDSLAVARALVDDGVDFLHLSLWTAQDNTRKRPDRHALQLFREVVPADLPLFVAGKVWTRTEAEHLLSLGADAVALGRSAIANPSWPHEAARDPSWQPRRPPLTVAELRDRGLNEAFANYMRRWKGFVAD